MATTKFLDSAGLGYLWGKIKDNFANKLAYDSQTGNLYLVDGLGNALEETINARRFGAISVSTYDELMAYATTDYLGLMVYLAAEVTHGDSTYAVGAYVVTGNNSILKLSASTASGDIDDAIIALQGRVTSLETALENIYNKDEVYTKDEVNALIPVPFGGVVENDLVLTFDNNKIGSTLTFGKEGNNIYLKGKNGAEIGTIDTTDFLVDGMIQNVDWSTEEGKENYLVFTFNTEAGAQPIEVDFGKYVDAYVAGEGISLDNKTFSIDFTKVEKAGAAAEVSASITGLLNNYVAKEEGKGLSTNDFTDELLSKLNNSWSKDELVAMSNSDIDSAIVSE